MKHQLSRFMPHSSLTGFTLLLGLAGSSLTSACSGYYPLGDISAGSRNDALVDDSTAGVPALAGALPPPDFTLDGYYGRLTSVGDLDGDGRDDIATLGGKYATQVPAVHLRYGGPRPANALEVLVFDQSGADLMLPGGYSDIASVAPAGDVDGDGYADLEIRTAECEIPQEGTGIYLVYGGPERLQGTSSLLEVAAHFVPAQRTASESTYGNWCEGVSPVGRAGDLDRDGIDDFVIRGGAPPLQQMDGVWSSGAPEGVYVFYGRAQRFSGDLALASADAVFPLAAGAQPVGDVNGDGRADLMMWADSDEPRGSHFVPGKSERYSGTLDLPSHSTFLAGYSDPRDTSLWRPMDLDGDGLNDLLLADQVAPVKVFYGRPRLFADGFDPSQADAALQHDETPHRLDAVGDRDGDGRDELLDQFNVPVGPVAILNYEVALLHGSNARLLSNFSFPESEVVARSGGVRFPKNSNRILETTIPGGDLDGDGAADLFTVSNVYTAVGEGAVGGNAPQLHVHYGVLAAPSQQPVH